MISETMTTIESDILLETLSEAKEQGCVLLLDIRNKLFGSNCLHKQTYCFYCCMLPRGACLKKNVNTKPLVTDLFQCV